MIYQHTVASEALQYPLSLEFLLVGLKPCHALHLLCSRRSFAVEFCAVFADVAAAADESCYVNETSEEHKRPGLSGDKGWEGEGRGGGRRRGERGERC